MQNKAVAAQEVSRLRERLDSVQRKHVVMSTRWQRATKQWGELWLICPRDDRERETNSLSLLHSACEISNESVVQRLLTSGQVDGIRNLPTARRRSTSPLGNYGPKAVTRLLIEQGVAMEAVTPNGRTPLYDAARNGHEGVARLLLERGARQRKLIREATGDYKYGVLGVLDSIETNEDD